MELLPQPDLKIKYEADQTIVGYLVLAALSPLWLGWSVVSIGHLLEVLSGGVLDAAAYIVQLVLHVFLVVTGVTAVALCLDNQIILRQDSVRLPSLFLHALGGRTRRRWKELEAVEFLTHTELSHYPEVLRLCFSDGRGVQLKLESFARGDLEKLLMAIEAHCINVSYDPPLNDVNLGIVSGITGNAFASGKLTFTQIWEEDLLSRFGPTAFVPLEAGAALQSDRLRVIGQMAFGGLSAVYLGKLQNELVVLKEAVLPVGIDDASRLKALEMFKREASLIASLKHPRIAKLVDYFVEDRRHYIVVEHIAGRDLRHLVRESGPQPELVALRWIAETAEILQFLHDHDPPIIHRDLTPDNLVLADDGGIVLIDFGAANSFVGSATGTLVGKQAYISPEQFRGKAEPKSDVYSLGCTLYFLLTGADPDALQQSHPADSYPGISSGADQLVASCTALEASERIASAAAVKDRAVKLIADLGGYGAGRITATPIAFEGLDGHA